MTFQELNDRIDIREVLDAAGYVWIRSKGARYPIYAKIDSFGHKIPNSMVRVNSDRKTCHFFDPRLQKRNGKDSGFYDVITACASDFKESAQARDKNHLVNLVCHNILNQVYEEKKYKPDYAFEPDYKPREFNIKEYDIHTFDRTVKDSHRKFYPYFKHRGIDYSTQLAFADHIKLTTRKTVGQYSYTNLAFPCRIPASPDKIVGFEERGLPSPTHGSYKGKAAGTNSAEGLWIASPCRTPLDEARRVLWFESGYDAMAYYQLKSPIDPDLSDAVFLSSGGFPTRGQMLGVLKAAPEAEHHICFDADEAGERFMKDLQDRYYDLVKENATLTDETVAYIDSVAATENKDYVNGDISLLPVTLRDQHEEWRAAAMTLEVLREKDDITPYEIHNMTVKAEQLEREFRTSLSQWLGLNENAPKHKLIREYPDYGKDWNEQLLTPSPKKYYIEINSLDLEAKRERFADLQQRNALSIALKELDSYKNIRLDNTTVYSDAAAFGGVLEENSDFAIAVRTVGREKKYQVYKKLSASQLRAVLIKARVTDISLPPELADTLGDVKKEIKRLERQTKEAYLTSIKGDRLTDGNVRLLPAKLQLMYREYTTAEKEFKEGRTAARLTAADKQRALAVANLRTKAERAFAEYLAPLHDQKLIKELTEYPDRGGKLSSRALSNLPQKLRTLYENYDHSLEREVELKTSPINHAIGIEEQKKETARCYSDFTAALKEYLSENLNDEKAEGKDASLEVEEKTIEKEDVARQIRGR